MLEFVAKEPLALHGGPPVFAGAWPQWPRSSPAILDALHDVAQSGRWAISGAYTGRMCWEKRFAAAFADYLGARHAVPTTNGTAALTIALESLGVGAGDEVLVPGLTWVACASAPLALGAIPILVDVDAATFSMSLQAAEAAIGPRTRAIVLVHAYCNVADAEAFRRLADRHGLVLIEDCSQAHGAEWRGRKVGTFGHASAFSLQQVKVLTCGEGGIATTDDATVAARMEELRADGRTYVAAPRIGELELAETATILGRNFCLSEFQAAVATVQLESLDAENRRRAENARLIADALAEIPGIGVPRALGQATRRTFYQFLVHLDPHVLGPYDPDAVVAALGAELGVFCELIDTPLNANRLYRPLASPRLAKDAATRRAVDPTRFDLPVARRLRQEHVAFGHWALLGGVEHRRAIVAAFGKIVDEIATLRRR